MSSLQEKYAELEELEARMNSVLQDLETLEGKKSSAEEKESPEEELTWEDVMAHEEENSIMEDEASKFLGLDPGLLSSHKLELDDEIVSRLKFWLTKGLKEKDEKDNLLRSIPRQGQVNLEAPILNEEIRVHLQSSALVRVKYFCDYQNLTGSALSNISSVLNGILNDSEVPLDRDIILEHLFSSLKLLSHLFFSLTQARKVFLLGRFEEPVQKIFEEIEPTTHLFGDNLKNVIDNSKVMEKVAKDLKPKSKQPPRQNSLNWKVPSTNRALSRGGFKSSGSRSQDTYRANFNRARPYPARKYYTQAQPQQHRRR